MNKNYSYSESLMAMLALKPRETGLSLDVFVSERTYAAQQVCRPSLIVRDRTGNTNAAVAFDSPIEVVMGTPITGKAWQALLRYVQLNQELLIALWNEEIDQMTYGQRQKSV